MNGSEAACHGLTVFGKEIIWCYLFIEDNENCLLKIFLEEFKSDEALIISISLQIANVPLLFYALFLSVNANEQTIRIRIIWAQLHM